MINGAVNFNGTIPKSSNEPINQDELNKWLSAQDITWQIGSKTFELNNRKYGVEIYFTSLDPLVNEFIENNGIFIHIVEVPLNE